MRRFLPRGVFMTAIFISYRQQDTGLIAPRIFEKLEAALGAGSVFMDAGRIPFGADFHTYFDEEVACARIVLVLIGHGWVDAMDEVGLRRLGNPDDYVRIEVESALHRRIPMGAVLIGGALMPRAEQLPESMRPLVHHNAAQVDDGPGFDAHMDRLIADLKQFLNEGGMPGGGDPALKVRPGSGEGFRDADALWCPEMVAVPAGSFMMGTPQDETGRLCKEHKGCEEIFKREGPQHKVTIAKPFAVARFAVTRSEFSAFASESGHDMSDGAYVWTGMEWKPDPNKSWRDPGFTQYDRHPVVCVKWDDAKAYAGWLSGKTGKDYRLLSEAEWEYACRAGMQTPFWWGSSISTDQANYDGNYTFGGGEKGEYRQKTLPVKSFQPNPWGLYQMHGNVWEWCEDCWNEDYHNAPGDGSAWRGGNCSFHVIRGGSWYDLPQNLRSASRYKSRYRDDVGAGFRLARTI
jgi:formylglycine-generating enzyme required for sulfatase activity